MDALGQLNPLDVVEAKIQEKIGRFLGLKAKLLELATKHGSPVIRDEAAQLLGAQKVLEQRLQDVLKKIEQLKVGAWSFGHIAEITGFSTDLLAHINAVEKLQQRAKTIERGERLTQSQTGTMPMNWIKVIGGIAAMVLFMRR